MQIKVTSVLVSDQAQALDFYTSVLGFEKKFDIPMGEARWLTVISPDAPQEVELLLEPNVLPAAQVYQAALYEAGIPCTMFNVDDLEFEHARLTGLGVKFRTEPTDTGPAKIAMLDDTCGNWIQLVELTA